ncbi:MAG TPA: TetR/AcrR family transcriptional regulator [Methanotrichaceae archaeon]|nr:TetR/AcrR family transcriptional regulator [Methanotrichaceae archaeon]
MSTADRKEREKERRRNEIIAAGEKLFFSKGYENVTMDEIARETELARGTLYLYFKNKDDICVAIAVRGLKILNGMFRDGCLLGGTGIEKIRSLLMALYEFHKKYPGYYATINYLQMHGFDKSDFPEMDEMEAIHGDSFAMVIEAFNEGIGDGTVKDDIDPVKATMVLTSSMQSMLCLPSTIEMPGGKITLDELVDYAAGLMLRSIGNVS